MSWNWRTILAVFFVGLVVAVQIIYWLNPFTIKDFISFRDEFLHFVDRYPIASGCSYVVVYTCSIIFGIPLSVTIIGGYLFGIQYGVLYTSLAIVLGSTILCSFVRYVMHDWIQNRYSNKLTLLHSEIKKYGALYIVMVHAIPFAPGFLPHVAAGLSSLELYKIIIANSIGSLPLTILYSAAGQYLHSLTSLRTFTMYTGMFGFVLALVWGGIMLMRYIINKR